MTTLSSASTRQGLVFAAGAYLCWGLFPLYWKPLHEVPALQILAHRIVWSALLLTLILAIRGQWGWLAESLRDKRRMALLAVSATMLSCNWLVYIWAVTHNRVIEASLGYFINPLVNVLLGWLVLGERLTRLQSIAVALSALGVAWLTFSVGTLPWIALVLAVSFGIYGLLRKTAHLPSLEGLALETWLLFPLALGALLWFEAQGEGVFGHAASGINLLLIGAGIVTTIPLLLFGAGARRLPMTMLGLLQYLSPTIQFLLGVWLYHEPFSGTRLIGYGLIWSALLLYSGVSLFGALRTRRT
ncbi:EamA family transporter RarD [Craterilacuibacter sinensis]|uniref:EamA family transporter RarD n=1 Tax=Craterilacuibacter sinensis TaxID=2686017 RepID=A0A845BN59_9NEIS|nr:EamA family transporter RarD [Craterilacuibacter sinensis]MXR35891.1 EamA family transporter RarD [Craterilacuibacter sinensis]RQW27119.1 EamA family transporter RarD [Rhodobacteraceae bacterium CH30]